MITQHRGRVMADFLKLGTIYTLLSSEAFTLSGDHEYVIFRCIEPH